MVWGSQAAGTWGGNLLHLAEAGVEPPTELDQAASHAVRSAPPRFRRPLCTGPLVREPAETRELFVVGSKLRVPFLQRSLLRRVDTVEPRDFCGGGTKRVALLLGFEAEARDLVLLPRARAALCRVLEPLGGGGVGLLLLLAMNLSSDTASGERAG